MTLEFISKLILSADNIGITYHVSPDGDAVGSVLALYNILKFLNKDCYVISKEKVSDNLQYLRGAENITGEITAPKRGTDLVVVLDCGNSERICADLEDFQGKIIYIDHHISNDYYGDYNYVDTNAAATAEIVYELINAIGIEFKKGNKELLDIGTCMYTSLVTDTGGFRHSNVTERTLAIASKLKSIGVNNTYIYESLFDNKEFNRIKIIGKALSSLELVLDNKVALFLIDKDFTKEFNMEIGDTSDIISYGLQIKGVEITGLIKEVEDGVKASLRAKGEVDVRKIAEIFGGGGHVKAAGLKIKDISIDEAKNKILNEVENEL